MSGEVAANGEANAAENELAIFARTGAGISMAGRKNADLLVMSGEPIDEPVVGRGPFVMNTHEEIERAFQDYQMGLMGEI